MTFKSNEQIDAERVRFLKRFGINSTKEFSDIIIGARISLGYSYREMSIWLECATPATIHRWEKGVCVPHNQSILQKLVEKNILMPRLPA